MKIEPIMVWKVGRALVRPKVMTRDLERPLLVMKTVFHLLPSFIQVL